MARRQKVADVELTVFFIVKQCGIKLSQVRFVPARIGILALFGHTDSYRNAAQQQADDAGQTQGSQHTLHGSCSINTSAKCLRSRTDRRYS